MGDGVSDLAFIRVTLMGMSGCGKTSLAQVFTNNVFELKVQPTVEPNLFYTSMNIAGSDDEESSFHAILEIEDTIGSDRKARFATDTFYDLWLPSTSSEKHQEASQKDVDDERADDGKRSLSRPLSVYRAPTDGQYRPLTRNRMAYFIVFDATKRKSYLEALKLHAELVDHQQKKQNKLKPIIYLVANKIDKDPWGDEFKQVQGSARMYSEGNAIRLFETSALQFRGVKKLFREVVKAVRVQQSLWVMDRGSEAVDDETSTEKCSVQ